MTEIQISLIVRVTDQVNITIDGNMIREGVSRKMTAHECFANVHKAVGTYMDISIPQNENVILLPTSPVPG